MNYFLNQWKLRLVKKYPRLNRILKANTGFIKEQLKETDYVLGGGQLNKKVLVPDGNWEPYLCGPERQSGRGVEPMDCVSVSLENVLEILFLKKFGIVKNFSDRFLAKISNTSMNGNSQSQVIEAARKKGLVDEEDWPSDLDNFSWSEFYKPIPSEVMSKATTFINDYEIGYEAVPVTIAAMREALKYSPLWTAGYAWSNANGVYQSYGQPNHAFVVYNIEQAVAFKWAFDSYQPWNKKLASQYQLYYPKLITISKRGEVYNISEIQNLLNRGFRWILRAQAEGEIYELSNEGLKYISSDDWNRLSVQLSAEGKKLVGVSEEFFNKLLA
jgi:hypothetical protein